MFYLVTQSWFQPLNMKGFLDFNPEKRCYINYCELLRITFIFAFFITCLKCQDIEILMISKVFFNTHWVKFLSLATATSSTKKLYAMLGCKLDGSKCLELKKNPPFLHSPRF